MKIIVIGTGYVGLIQGVCLAELGNEVVCIDVDEIKINKLKKGISPIFEPGVEELLSQNIRSGRIKFDTDLKKHIKGAEIIFIAVGTPSDDDGRAELKYVISAAEDIGRTLSDYAIIINKSTVPIGTGEMVKKTIKKYYHGKFDVCSNPEFLREGSAIDDFMHPDRIIIGDNNGQQAMNHKGTWQAAEKVAKLYQVLDCPILITNLETAEMIKYASNSYLANQISFINSVALICEKVGADVSQVSQGMKLDKRIGPRAFLSAGLGYGGSCFPKDVLALINIARDSGVEFKILKEVEAVNKSQRQKFILKIKGILEGNKGKTRGVKGTGGIKGKKIGVWGVAFKPRTDDLRDAPAVTIIEALSDLGVKITAYDPVAAINAKKLFPQVKFVNHSLDVCKNADALVIITEWDEFKQVDLKKVKELMKHPVIFDGRNLYDPAEMKALGFKYYSIGRASK